MKKILYISDLDGTLLQPDATLSDYSTRGLNRLMDQGFLFSVATARTVPTVRRILCDLHLSFPVVLMNGVLVYDLKKEEYIKVEAFEKSALKRLIDCMKKNGVQAFLYALVDGVLEAFYEKINTPFMQEFYDDRTNIYKVKFHKVDSFYDMIEKQVIYFTVRDHPEKLRPMYEEALQLAGLDSAFYYDTYGEGIWFLELFSDRASKKNAIAFLREQYKLDRIICFGDNFNDLPMFSVCEERYAVGNALPEVKEAATATIGKNTEDGVMKFLEKNGH